MPTTTVCLEIFKDTIEPEQSIEGQVEKDKNENSEGEIFWKKTGNIMVNYIDGSQAGSVQIPDPPVLARGLNPRFSCSRTSFFFFSENLLKAVVPSVKCGW